MKWKINYRLAGVVAVLLAALCVPVGLNILRLSLAEARDTRKALETEKAGNLSGLRKKIESLTGARTKLVWVRDLGGGKDPFTHGNRFALMGLDTDDAEGIRRLLPETDNFSRPMISPDGEQVIFSRRNGKEEGGTVKWSPEIHIWNWKDRQDRVLRAGYAVDVWRNPADGGSWIYAVKSLKDGAGPNPDGSDLVRFPLSDPEKEESVWSRGMITTDNLQVNRSGTAASALVPWPNAGRFDFQARQFVRLTTGCWPSLAPDDSGLSWVFDGKHEHLRMFLPGLRDSWKVDISHADTIKGRAGYHPRWSNDPRIVTFTGPFRGRVHIGGKGVEVVVARLNAAMTKVEDSLSLRDKTKNPDWYPDVWVEGGEKNSLDVAAIGPDDRQPAPVIVEAETWAVSPEALAFVWQDANSPNQVSGPSGPRECSVAAQGQARFDAHRGMLTGGGWFAADEDSAKAVAGALAGGPWSLEMAVIPRATEWGAVVVSAGPALEVRMEGPDLIAQRGARAWRVAGGLTPGSLTHVVMGGKSADEVPWAIVNGAEQVIKPTDANDLSQVPAGLSFGSRPDGSELWDGVLEAIAIHGQVPDPRTAVAHAGLWRKRLTERPPIPQSKVRAKVLEVSEILDTEDIGSYTRALTTVLFQREAVLSGPDPGEQFTAAFWTVLGQKPVDSGSLKKDAELELTLEPLPAHPELESERTSDEVSSGEIPDFLEVSPPGSVQGRK